MLDLFQFPNRYTQILLQMRIVRINTYPKNQNPNVNNAGNRAEMSKTTDDFGFLQAARVI